MFAQLTHFKLDLDYDFNGKFNNFLCLSGVYYLLVDRKRL